MSESSPKVGQERCFVNIFSRCIRKDYKIVLFRKANGFVFYRYCTEHSRKAQIARIKSTSRRSLPETPEMLLLNLSHYVKPTDSSAEDTEEERGKVKALDPFSEHYRILILLYSVQLYIFLYFYKYKMWKIFVCTSIIFCMLTNVIANGNI